MRPTNFHAEDIARILKRQKIATITELKTALGTEVDSTVFRKLKELAYRTSYSHRGCYYTLDALARFDEAGLWSFRSVWFSRHGTLLSTVEALVSDSEAGYYASELQSVVHVSVKVSLLKLIREQRLSREKILGHLLYVSSHGPTRKKQLAARQVHQAEPAALGLGPGVLMLPDELKAAIVLFWSLLDEKQRRLYAGLEAMKFGHGGAQKIADLLGMDVGTVAKGRRDLLSSDVEIGRVRRQGGGRSSAKKKRRRSSPGSKKS